MAEDTEKKKGNLRVTMPIDMYYGLKKLIRERYGPGTPEAAGIRHIIWEWAKDRPEIMDKYFGGEIR